MTAVLPPARVAIAGNAPPSREWYRYFQAATQVNLDVGTLRHDVDALTVRVTALEDAPPSSGDVKITGTGSIYVSATAVKVVSLEGDAEDPGFTTYYGTDVTGAKGWYAVSDALASSGNIAKSTDAAGVTSFDLVDLADSGAGAALVKITRDAKGRISGTSAANTTDLAEGTNLYFTDERAQDAAGSALDGTGDVPLAYDDAGNKISAALSAGVLASLAKADSALQPGDMPPGYIDGLKMVWVSGTALTVTSGSAYIPGVSAVLSSPADIAKTGLSLTASTWYHVYLYDNAGTPDFELSTTAPAAAYNGTARSKTGDSSRRYIGSLKTDSASSILNFGQAATYIAYRNFQGGSPFRVLANGTSLTETSVSLSGCVPVTSTLAQIRVINTAGTSSSNAQVYTGTSNDSASGPPAAGIITVDPSKDGYVMHPLNDSQAMTYWYRVAGVGGGAYIDVYGYSYER